MNLRTFYRLFYKHRIAKASFFLKLYIFIVVPLKYFINIFYFEKKVNLDLYKNNFSDLFKKDLNTLFEHFNSDKGEYFVNFPHWGGSFVNNPHWGDPLLKSIIRRGGILC